MLADWGEQLDVRIVYRCDSSAARGMSARQWLGKLHHSDVRHLWVQQQVLEKRVQIVSISTFDKLADVFTKPLDDATMR
eukprot:9117396-Heterocapsa_arctica.AAC.1